MTESTFLITFLDVEAGGVKKWQPFLPPWLYYLVFSNNTSILVLDPFLAFVFYLTGGFLRSGDLFVVLDHCSRGMRLGLAVFPPLIPVSVFVNTDGSVGVPGTNGFCRQDTQVDVVTKDSGPLLGAGLLLPALPQRAVILHLQRFYHPQPL